MSATYAIIADGGRQYRVEPGQQLEVDLRCETKRGQQIEFDQVVALRDENGLQIGRPTLAGVRVVAEVLGPVRGEKIVVQKFKRRKNYRRKQGHRQWYTQVVIRSIETE